MARNTGSFRGPTKSVGKKMPVKGVKGAVRPVK